MWMTKRENGVWYARWTEDGRERWKSLGTSAKGEARRRMVGWEEALARREAGEGARSLGAGPAWDAYRRGVRGRLRESTVAQNEKVWRVFWAESGLGRLEEVMPARARAWAEGRLAMGRQASTVNVQLAALSAIWNVLRRQGIWSGENPWTEVERFRTGERSAVWLEVEEVGWLLQSAATWDRGHRTNDMEVFSALGVFAGLRLSEIRGMRWGWVRWPAAGTTGCIQVPGSAEGFESKGGRGRTVPLSARLAHLLEPRRALPEAHVFRPFRRGGGEVSRTLRRIGELAGIEKRVTPHVLRHTFASHCVINGIDVFKVQRWLGHRDIQTTMVYAHLRPTDPELDRAFAGMDEALGG